MGIMDLIFSVLLLCGLALSIYYIFKGKLEDEDYKGEIYSIENLCQHIKKTINNIINMDMEALNLNQRDLENRRAIKRSLSNAIRKCSQGDINAKMVVMARTKHTILNLLNITEDIINNLIPFNNKDRLSARDKFEILMYM